MHFEYHSTCKSLLHITLFIVRYAYVSDSLSRCKTACLGHMYEPKTQSANIVQRIHMSIEYNSFWTDTGFININLLILNTDVSGSFFQRKTVKHAHM